MQIQQQINTVDFSGFGKYSKNDLNRSKSSAGNKNQSHVAVIVISFTITAILYGLALKNINPGKPNIDPRPAMDNSQE